MKKTKRGIFLDPENVSNKSYYNEIGEMLNCCICTGILINPYQCEKCENSFCKHCITQWIEKSNVCPFKCNTPILKESSRVIKNLLDKLYFQYNNTNISYQNIVKILLNNDTNTNTNNNTNTNIKDNTNNKENNNNKDNNNNNKDNNKNNNNNNKDNNKNNDNNNV